jgi:hypothetical protein
VSVQFCCCEAQFTVAISWRIEQNSQFTKASQYPKRITLSLNNKFEKFKDKIDGFAKFPNNLFKNNHRIRKVKCRNVLRDT